jgi:ADP-ribose pyrophosphatase YjhB (NUDIX family)
MAMKKLDHKTLSAHKGVSFVGVTTVALCHDGKGNFVMMKRGLGARDEHGRWDIIGGGLKVGQPIIENLKREIKEELCADATDIKYIGFRDVHRELEDGTKTHWVSLDHVALVDPKQVKIGEPEVFDELGWFTLDNLPSPLHSQLHLLIDKHKNLLKNLIGLSSN